MATNDHVYDLIPAYALDCLDPVEVTQVTEHLAGCSECQAELRAYQAVVDQLPLAAPDMQPSVSTKEGLMRRIQSSVQSDMPSQAHPTEAKPSLWLRMSDWLQKSSPAWGLAGMALIAVLLVSNLVLIGQVSALKTAGGETALQVINLAGTSNTPQATGVIIMSKNGEQGTLVVDRLPALDPNHQYQLWLNKAGERDSGGVFSVDNAGYASLWVWSPDPLADYTSFGITVEPKGGSPGPTGQKVLGGNL
jgi:anti-sigma-K factor RskA